jgi:cytochrome c-type biogenesis protein
VEVNLLTPLIAFAAGLLSCISPCVLPLLPAYVANLSGVSAGAAANPTARLLALRHAVSFVFGFTLVFVLLGASVGFVGYAVRDHVDLFRKVGGLLMILMGLQAAEIIRLPYLSRTFAFNADVPSSGVAARVGYARSVGLGSALAVGWTPCIGPTLGGILTLASTSGGAWQGTGLLLAYSAGLAVPFLVAGFAVDRTSALVQRMRPLMPAITIASGIVLIFAGMLVYTNALARYNRYFAFGGPGSSI